MAAPTISRTLLQLRQRISRRIGDLEDGTASGGTTTTMTETGDPSSKPAGYYAGAEVSIITGTGSVQSRIATASTTTGGTVTITVPTWTAPDSASTYEIHKLAGRGFYKADYDGAINSAIDALADVYFTDTDSVPFGVERVGTPADTYGVPRHEYPMPTGFNYLYAIDYLDSAPSVSSPMSYFDTYRNMGDVAARTRLWQGFQVDQAGWYEWFSLALNLVGTITDNLILDVMTDSSGVPSGTTVTDGTSDTLTGSTLDERLKYVVFRFNPPIYLAANTQYHMVLRRSAAVSSANYFRWAEDTGNTYGDGTAGTGDGSNVYTAVSGSDFSFAIFPASTKWVELPPSGWGYRRVGGDFILLKVLPYDGTPIRLRGLAAIAEVSVETTAIPVRADWVEAYALAELLSGHAGKTLSDNYAQAARIWSENVLHRPRPYRILPPNSIKIYA